MRREISAELLGPRVIVKIVKGVERYADLLGHFQPECVLLLEVRRLELFHGLGLCADLSVYRVLHCQHENLSEVVLPRVYPVYSHHHRE